MRTTSIQYFLNLSLSWPKYFINFSLIEKKVLSIIRTAMSSVILIDESFRNMLFAFTFLNEIWCFLLCFDVSSQYDFFILVQIILSNCQTNGITHLKSLVILCLHDYLLKIFPRYVENESIFFASYRFIRTTYFYLLVNQFSYQYQLFFVIINLVTSQDSFTNLQLFFLWILTYS